MNVKSKAETFCADQRQLPYETVSFKTVNTGNYRFTDKKRRAAAVTNYFRDRFFKGNITQPIDQTLRDYNTCAAQFGLTEKEKATYFVNILESTGRDFFFDNYETSILYEPIKQMMKR